MAEQKPKFDLAVINPTYTFGPIQRNLVGLWAVNTSNQRIRDMVWGKMREGLTPTAPVFTFVDVRDVALAHVRAMVLPEAGGQRFYLVSGHFSNKRIADVIWEKCPVFRTMLPPVEETRDDLPPDVYGFDNTKSRAVLGIEYRALEDSVQDTVHSMYPVSYQFGLHEPRKGEPDDNHFWFGY